MKIKSLTQMIKIFPRSITKQTSAGSTPCGRPDPYDSLPPDTLEKKLERIFVKQEFSDSHRKISDVLYRYARGWDHNDETALRSCFFHDSTHNHGTFQGASSDFITLGLKTMRKVKTSSHMITNITIVISGNRAVSECYFLSHHRRRKPAGVEEDWILKGRYIDQFEKRDKIWKIAHRLGLNDFSMTLNPAETSYDSLVDSGSTNEDPFYSRLEDLYKN